MPGQDTATDMASIEAISVVFAAVLDSPAQLLRARSVAKVDGPSWRSQKGRLFANGRGGD